MSGINDKIQHTLEEARMIIPGAQALIGFQFIAVFNDSFHALPENLQILHAASLTCVILSTVLLMAPAAYHRAAFKGEDTSEFHTFASRLLLIGTVPLIIGVNGDYFIIINSVTHSPSVSLISMLLLTAVFCVFWYVFPLLKKQQAG